MKHYIGKVEADSQENLKSLSSKSAIFESKWLITNMLKHTKNANNSGIRFYKQIYNEYHFTKTAEMLDTKNCLQHHIVSIYGEGSSAILRLIPTPTIYTTSALERSKSMAYNVNYYIIRAILRAQFYRDYI